MATPHRLRHHADVNVRLATRAVTAKLSLMPTQDLT